MPPSQNARTSRQVKRDYQKRAGASNPKQQRIDAHNDGLKERAENERQKDAQRKACQRKAQDRQQKQREDRARGVVGKRGYGQLGLQKFLLQGQECERHRQGEGSESEATGESRRAEQDDRLNAFSLRLTKGEVDWPKETTNVNEASPGSRDSMNAEASAEEVISGENHPKSNRLQLLFLGKSHAPAIELLDQKRNLKRSRHEESIRLPLKDIDEISSL